MRKLITLVLMGLAFYGGLKVERLLNEALLDTWYFSKSKGGEIREPLSLLASRYLVFLSPPASSSSNTGQEGAQLFAPPKASCDWTTLALALFLSILSPQQNVDTLDGRSCPK